jgi:hypothetical protein
MALNAAGIATGIAALNIAGVTVLDITAMPDAVTKYPALVPGPQWIAGGIGSAEDGEGPATFGPGMWVFQRAFSYRYFHAPTGAGRGLLDHYSAMTANLDAITTALTLLDVAGVDVMQIENSEFGVVEDPAGSKFYGFDLAITLKERINA